jgi:putative polyhydroxyalkanoate system protein
MSTLSIAKKHHLTHKKAKAAAEKVAEDLRDRFDLEYIWRGDCIDFQRSGLSGTLFVDKNEVRLECRLGFILSALKPSIEREVHKELDKQFSDSR